ncbi:peptide deformylase [Geoalkalibacter sp.]|uniref:peptide deformylase n=1 Tax=Geoalkalibacter sp. TaxID=3041440 RepID=UPI00272ECC5C|nr:peptide deformylase [Geoalkalibacter sp.]
MALRRILHYPDPLLRQVSQPVAEIDDEIRELARDMAETMYAAPGVGLAAPQVGVLKRLIVLDCARQDEAPQLMTAVNPEILEGAGEINEEEGCLSVPSYYARVVRQPEVRVRFLNLDGAVVEMNAEGLLAVAFQHEIDHLNGVLFVDHLSSLKKSLFKKKYKKILEQKQEEL